LGGLKREEEALVKEIGKVEEQIEGKKASTERFKAVAADIGEEIDEMKRRLSAKNKEINDMRKRINSVEAKLLDKKLERHAVLKNAKLELIELPMLRGTGWSFALALFRIEF
jgi:predicted  nucleic acid-binding Zn-ribbon protein